MQQSTGMLEQPSGSALVVLWQCSGSANYNSAFADNVLGNLINSLFCKVEVFCCTLAQAFSADYIETKSHA